MKYLIILLLLIPVCYAGIDMTVKPSLDAGNIESVMNPTAWSNNTNNIDLGFLLIPVSVATGGGGGGRGTSLYYDVIIDVEKDKYETKEILNITIIIINKGHMPDRDGKLYTYIESPTGQRWREWERMEEVIPPTCPEGRYDFYDDVCLLNNGTILNSTKWVLNRMITLPNEPEIGEWKAYAEYASFTQPRIKVFDSFEVYLRMYNIWLLIAIICFILFIVFDKRRSQKKPKRG